MSDWKKDKLNTIAQESRVLVEPSGSEILPYIGLEHISQGELSLIGYGMSSDAASTKKKFVKGDILFGTLRPYFRKVVRPNFDGVCSTDISVIRAKKGNSQGFLFYLIASQPFIDFASVISNGTKMPRAKWGVFAKTEWDIPVPKEQHHIASILSAYDELIDNNNRRIALLEHMAEQIYKEWFVRLRFPGYENAEFEKGVPKEWRVKKLNKIVTTQYGYTASADFDIEGPKFLRITDIASSNIDWDNVPYCHINENEIGKYKLNFGDIVIARTGATAGYAKRIHKLHPTSVFASYLVRLKLKDLRLNYYIGLIVESNTYKEFVMSIAGGAAQPQANANVLTEISVFVPEMQVLEEFNKIIEPICDQIEVLIQQNQNLKQTRDLLLPRLISGKLKVSEL